MNIEKIRTTLNISKKLIQAGYRNLAEEVISILFDEDLSFQDETESRITPPNVKEIAKEYIDKFFKEYELPMPEIKIKDNLGAKWLGQQVCQIGRFNDDFTSKSQSIIELQKAILDDDRTLRRVIAHELIHHFQCFHSYTLFKADPEEFRKYNHSLKFNWHGETFKEWADKMNNVLGHNFVTEKSDEEDVLSTPKNFYIVVHPERNGYMYAWFQRKTDQISEQLRKVKEDGKVKVFETNNRRFTRGPVFSKNGTWGVPKDQPTQDLLEEIYESGEEIPIEEKGLSVPKKFYILVKPNPNNKESFVYVWIKNISTRKDLVQKYKSEGAKVFETTDRRFLLGTLLNSRLRYWSRPHDTETNDLLKELYETGKEVAI